MTQYIPLDAVVAEIDKRQRMLDLDSPLGRGGMVELQVLKDKLNTLEVEEVDYKPIDKDFERDAVQFCFENSLNTTPRIARTIAKHFFELGLKAQKGE